MGAPTTDRGGIQQTIRALVAEGWDLLFVWDGEDRVPVTMEPAAIEAITAVDDSRLYVGKGAERGWVRFVLGNAPDEVVCDYTTNLTCVDTLTESWWA
jgi:hypothetical protein